jgi:hypothetical protein
VIKKFKLRVRPQPKPVLRQVEAVHRLAPRRDGDIDSPGLGPARARRSSGLQSLSGPAPLEGGPLTGFDVRRAPEHLIAADAAAPASPARAGNGL